MDTEKVTSHVVRMDDEQICRLHAILEEGGWMFSDFPHAHWQGKRDRTAVTAYRSGKVTVQGRGTADVVLYVIEPRITGVASLGYEAMASRSSAIQAPEFAENTLFTAHAGIDESGKGDYFGPLVIAAAYVTEKTEPILRKMGVRDSKTISSDAAIRSLAERIRRTVDGAFALVIVGPTAYNRMYANIGNLNRLLAWGHARALENLLEKAPECRAAISDKFGNESLIERALLEKGRTVKLTQIVKGERDLAVAAASILARDGFVRKIDALGKEIGIVLPKGAGPEVLRVGREIVRSRGSDALGPVAKLHFKTTKVICGE
jgi:ribonuclease HIII